MDQRLLSPVAGSISSQTAKNGQYSLKVGQRVDVDGHLGTVTKEKHPDTGLPVIKYDGQ